MLCLGGQRGPDCIVDTTSTALNFRKPNKFFVNDASGPRPGLTHNYLNATEPQSLTEVTMKTRVEKLGPGSWAVLVNGQRQHEIFRTRAAARSEANRQKDADKIDNQS